MTGLAAALPFLVVVATVALGALLFRLNRRISRGSESAGPRHVDWGQPPGQRRTPWELEAIDAQLDSPIGSTPRHDLINTVNRLAASASVNSDHRLHVNASNDQIAGFVAYLETQLQFPDEQLGSDPG